MTKGTVAQRQSATEPSRGRSDRGSLVQVGAGSTTTPSPATYDEALEIARGIAKRGEAGMCGCDEYTICGEYVQIARAFVALAQRSETRESTPWESLKYLHISTARDGQWADQAVHSFVGSLLARHEDDMASVSATAGTSPERGADYLLIVNVLDRFKTNDLRFGDDIVNARLAAGRLMDAPVSATASTDDVPLCGGHAQAWFTERNHLTGDHRCVVCAFLGQKP